MLYPHPKVEMPMDGVPDLTRLQTAIRETTGFAYGYLPHDLKDTTILSFTLTLCGRYDGRGKLQPKRGLSKTDLWTVDAVIRAWALGAGKGMPRITWPHLEGIVC